MYDTVFACVGDGAEFLCSKQKSKWLGAQMVAREGKCEGVGLEPNRRGCQRASEGSLDRVAKANGGALAGNGEQGGA